jgi:hypothetical protein
MAYLVVSSGVALNIGQVSSSSLAKDFLLLQAVRAPKCPVELRPRIFQAACQINCLSGRGSGNAGFLPQPQRLQHFTSTNDTDDNDTYNKQHQEL